ncbi:MAG: protein translocase subunit SecF [Halobacteriales archaeon]
MISFDVPEPDYDRYSNRQLAAVPLAVLLVALLVIGATWALTGAPASLGIELSGGTELTVQTTDDRADIQTAFDEDVESVQQIQGETDQYILTFETIDEEGLSDQAEANLESPTPDDPVVLSSREFSASFAAEQQQMALYAVAVGFLGMGLIVFLLFRTFIPSIAIIVSAFSDIMIPLAAMNLLGISLSLGTVAALLMLIGYSVDSDILLNNHILRRGGEFYESTYRAMQTGVTMTVTSMSAMFVMFVVAFVFGIEILSNIGLILFIGLAADLLNTYSLNLSLLRWYSFRGVS